MLVAVAVAGMRLSLLVALVAGASLGAAVSRDLSHRLDPRYWKARKAEAAAARRAEFEARFVGAGGRAEPLVKRASTWLNADSKSGWLLGAWIVRAGCADGV